MHDIPPLSYGDQETCAVCMATMQDDSTIIVWLKPCYHKLHCVCAMRAIMKSDPDGIKCPICRQKVEDMMSSCPSEADGN